MAANKGIEPLGNLSPLKIVLNLIYYYKQKSTPYSEQKILTRFFFLYLKEPLQRNGKNHYIQM